MRQIIKNSIVVGGDELSKNHGRGNEDVLHLSTLSYHPAVEEK